MGGHHTKGYEGPLQTHHLSADDQIGGVRIRKIARERSSQLMRFKMEDGSVLRFEPGAVIENAELREDRR